MELILFLAGAYFIGNFLTAHILMKLFRKRSINSQGSGNPGARNIGRLYGKKAFLITFLGDALKGSLVILVGRMLEFTEIELLFGLILAVIGHIKPIFFRFKGGKGVSTFIGGIITFEPLLAIVIVSGFFIIYPFTKSFTISGLGAFCLIPLTVSYLYQSMELMWTLVVLIIIIILAHSENLIKKFRHT
ncbi:glycerol-3-phosphate acyltransferase [Cytobacillus depressus]|uniref:Glycerol-3-phosphate acyltransferase n=1 Tax=Cytobacillus depressus TaxID=1602942 RepID=A0A6L3V4J0_9BACI|nr:glycerol-3-phosphate acyltransferase [Cytobacillus depressus]KAB2333249.1 glycerol-3-phosphate acyltransferase [Cytobacillus depressus]